MLPENSEYRAVMRDSGYVFTGADLGRPLQTQVRSFRASPHDFYAAANSGQHDVHASAAEVHLSLSFDDAVSFGGNDFNGFKKRSREVDFIIPADSVISISDDGYVLGEVEGAEKLVLDPSLLDSSREKLESLRELSLRAQAAGQGIADAIRTGLIEHRGGPVVVRNGFIDGSRRRHSIVGQAIGLAGVDPRAGQVRLTWNIQPVALTRNLEWIRTQQYWQYVELAFPQTAGIPGYLKDGFRLWPNVLLWQSEPSSPFKVRPFIHALR